MYAIIRQSVDSEDRESYSFFRVFNNGTKLEAIKKVFAKLSKFDRSLELVRITKVGGK